jgi:hypothetical protein
LLPRIHLRRCLLLLPPQRWRRAERPRFRQNRSCVTSAAVLLRCKITLADRRRSERDRRFRVYTEAPRDFPVAPREKKIKPQAPRAGRGSLRGGTRPSVIALGSTTHSNTHGPRGQGNDATATRATTATYTTARATRASRPTSATSATSATNTCRRDLGAGAAGAYTRSLLSSTCWLSMGKGVRVGVV